MKMGESDNPNGRVLQALRDSLQEAVIAAAKLVDRELYHKHTDHCYGRYEPCGEHHVHDMHCGGSPLICRQRESGPELEALHQALKRLG
jgi:hypothetical protein